MIASVVQDRTPQAAEYLELLRSLAGEMERAMQAIARNALSDLQDSIANQQIVSARLVELADELSVSSKTGPAGSSGSIDEDLMHQILVDGETLQKVNRRYAALLQHSSRSVALMLSLFNSFKGQFKEASGPRLKHQTWSCQI